MIKNRIQCGVINIHLLTALGLRLNTIRDPVAKVRKKNLTCTNISAQLLPNLSKKDIFICAYAKKMYLCAGFLNKQSKFNEHGSTITKKDKMAEGGQFGTKDGHIGRDFGFGI